MSEDCLFCSIIQTKVDAEMLYEDEQVMVIRDAYPRAPFHVLVLPKKHLETLHDFGVEHKSLLSHMLITASRIAREYRHEDCKLVWNVGHGGGQRIFHAHLHVMAGKEMKE